MKTPGYLVDISSFTKEQAVEFIRHTCDNCPLYNADHVFHSCIHTQECNKKCETLAARFNQQYTSKLHSNGPWHVNNGSMYNQDTTVMLDESVSVIYECDMDEDPPFFIFHKVGTEASMKQYLDDVVNRYTKNGLAEMVADWRQITFHIKNETLGFAPEGYDFDIDEICTLINWFHNSPGASATDIIEGKISLEEIKEKIKRLMEIGF